MKTLNPTSVSVATAAILRCCAIGLPFQDALAEANPDEVVVTARKREDLDEVRWPRCPAPVCVERRADRQ